MLLASDFDVFFEGVYGHEPFPWQKRLVRHVIERGAWPQTLDLPTGVGKTAAMDIALFHLAVELERDRRRRAPIRIAFVVDRRLVVDDAFVRAEKLAHALRSAEEGVVADVARALSRHADEDGPPLVVRALRGGIPREDDWARTPGQPTILCSTVDQVGSRLLFRGYGVSDSMKPVHAGLLGADCLILLDEAHLAEPFRQTLDWVEAYRGASWRRAGEARPWGVALLTATPGLDAQSAFALDAEDLAHPVLRRRLEAEKPARLVLVARGRESDDTNETGDAENEVRGLPSRAAALVSETVASVEHFSDPLHGVAHPAIGVVVNRVARARAVFERLSAEREDADVLLLIGPSRPVDRDDGVRALAAIRTGEDRLLERPLIIVATQCIEAGVDIDLDALITEAAPLDALRQRFGRLNRAGRDIVPFAAIMAWKSDVSSRNADPVYGRAIKAAWDALKGAATKGRHKIVGFGVLEFVVPLAPETLSPKDDAPVLLPAYLDLLCQTSPIPTADPEVGFFLHGAKREPDAVTVVWRADIEGKEPVECVRRLLTLAPPRAAEAIGLPVWVVRRWLQEVRSSSLGDLADTATLAPEDEGDWGRAARRVFRWKGDDERSRWASPLEIRPGDTIIVPARFGGVDRYGWNPRYGPASDVGAKAARPFAGRRFAVRVAPGLIDGLDGDALADALAGSESMRWKDLRSALLELSPPADLRQDLQDLDSAKLGRVVVYVDAYPKDANGRPRGIVFLAPLGVRDGELDVGGVATTEDDQAGSLGGVPIPLVGHCEEVSAMALQFAEAAGLPNARRVDLKVAGLLHDIGKADPRFQSWLHYCDPLGPDLMELTSVLAKSGRDLPRSARKAAELPAAWRHEAFSVRVAPYVPAFSNANDPDLVLWLIGSHHGFGRPLFPHKDPADTVTRALPSVLGLPSEVPAEPGPQSLAFDWDGADWSMLYGRLRARYGLWELALMEAVLRLADHRTSERESRRRG